VRIHFARVVVLTVFVLLTSGCRIFRPNAQLDLPVADFLPADWTPLGALRPVNIDDDAATEFLLLYRYDSGDPEQPNGPVGAVIYDSQAEAQELVDFQSYRILPSYSAPAAHSSIAPPEQTNVTDRQVLRESNEMGGSQTALPNQETPTAVTPTPRFDELILFGGNTHMTVIWWQNAVDGYGVAQIYAPGGLHSFDFGATGADAETTNRPVQSVRGFFPLNDRSLLCEQRYYERNLDTANDAADSSPPLYAKNVRYEPSAEGLRFCYGTPPHPYYPEGVTLAYLLDPMLGSPLWHPGLTPDQRTNIFDRLRTIVENAGGSLNGPLQVKDVKAYRTIPIAPGAGATTQTFVDTRTCAIIVTPNGQERAMLFTLRYVPPGGVGSGMTDRLFIADIALIPAPVGGPRVDCGQIIENGVPER